MMLSRGRGPVFGTAAMRGIGPGNIDQTRMGGVRRGSAVGNGFVRPDQPTPPLMSGQQPMQQQMQGAPNMGIPGGAAGLRGAPTPGAQTQIPAQQPNVSQQMLQDFLIKRMLQAPAQPGAGQRPVNPALMGYGQQTQGMQGLLR